MDIASTVLEHLQPLNTKLAGDGEEKYGIPVELRSLDS
jgi:hypothetical protein